MLKTAIEIPIMVAGPGATDALHTIGEQTMVRRVGDVIPIEAARQVLVTNVPPANLIGSRSKQFVGSTPKETSA